MGMTDPISDMLTRIRNGIMVNLEHVDMPSSKMKLSIAKLLMNEGYINNIKSIKDNKQGVLRVYLKYGSSGKGAIYGIKRISKPSCRVYVKKDKIPNVLNGMGVAIISTSGGIVTDREARKMNLGGEFICSVW